MKSISTLKTEALTQFLGIEPGDIHESKYDDCIFEYRSEEYLVLTDDEADSRAKEYCLETAWAFNKSFLDCHSDAIAEMDDKTFSVIQEQCESANKAILCMLDDKEHFASDAIASDGRGHFLSQYDGEENEVKVGETYFFIYRTN